MPVTFDEALPAGPSTPSKAGAALQMKKRKSSLKSYDSSTSQTSGGSASAEKKRGVSFHDEVTVRALPANEAEDALDTRKGKWEAAPDHDELWDGDSRDFWEQEKTIEEVRRIIVVRGMRMALRYNLGYGFFALVSNFKRRKPVNLDDEQAVMDREHPDENDVVPQFDSPDEEDLAIRKEFRELFVDSVKGLDFPDLVQDREAFEKMYIESVLSRDELSRPDHGLFSLRRIEALVDEIMNDEEVCLLVGVAYERPRAPTVDVQHNLDVAHAADVEEQRRHEHHKPEVEPHGTPDSSLPASVGGGGGGGAPDDFEEVNPAAVSPTSTNDDDIPIFASAGRAAVVQTPPHQTATPSSLEPTTPAESTPSPQRRGSAEPLQRRASLTLNPSESPSSPAPGRRASLEGSLRRASLEPTPVAEAGAAAGRRGSLQGARRTSLEGGAAEPFATRRGSLDGGSSLPRGSMDMGGRRRSSLGDAQVDEIEIEKHAIEAATAPEQRPRRASLEESLPEGVISEAVLEKRHSRRGSFPLIFVNPPPPTSQRFEPQGPLQLVSMALIGAMLSVLGTTVSSLAVQKPSLLPGVKGLGPAALLVPLFIVLGVTVYLS